MSNRVVSLVFSYTVCAMLIYQNISYLDYEEFVSIHHFYFVKLQTNFQYQVHNIDLSQS